ncbi:hypothetical protein [Flavobacterium sp. N1994]|uniref:hypothetical protein n=1 Tax=Flavobacterium sp. N1994 TaxID=2986827 RepID=UPI00222295B7|nr:hypothetical protein [Flavobacterium sp. N1994]
MKLRHSLLLAILLFFTFCSSSIAQRLPDEAEPLRFHKDYTENGLIFGTITFPNEKMRFDNYSILINYITSDKKLRRKYSNNIRIDPTMFVGKHYGELEGGKTYLFVMEKEPGEYTIPSVKFTIFKLFDSSPQFSNANGFSIPFTVNKGEITYIGEININEYALKGEPIITIEDKFERDKNAMKSRYKMVNWDAAVKSKFELFHPDGDEKISNY